jgi:transcription elongation factor Elf1
MRSIPDTVVKKEYECLSCGSMYDIQWDSDEVDIAFSGAGAGPKYCSFCGEEIEVEEMEHLLDINFTDHVEFGKGVELVDGDGEED